MWIETTISWFLPLNHMSHPAWVCGLKQDKRCKFSYVSHVTPCVGVWIETVSLSSNSYSVRQSHPAWVCGLKQDKRCKFSYVSHVTPCVGVWIETSILQQRVNLPLLSHPAWVCGLKQVNDSFKQCRNRSHTLRGCVD